MFREAMKSKCVTACLVVFGLATIVGMSGCAGTLQETRPDGTVVKTPASVAVIQASADSHATCGEEMGFSLSVDEISKLSASAQAEAMRNVPMMALLGYLKEKEGGGCHEQIASETREFFRAQSVKYQQFGMVGKTGLIGGFTYLGFKSMFDALAAVGQVGDTNIGEVNVSGATDGASGEGSFTGGNVEQNINLGNGSLSNATDGGMNSFGEKPIQGDGNSFDDSGDGSNNNPGFFN